MGTHCRTVTGGVTANFGENLVANDFAVNHPGIHHIINIIFIKDKDKEIKLSSSATRSKLIQRLLLDQSDENLHRHQEILNFLDSFEFPYTSKMRYGPAN